MLNLNRQADQSYTVFTLRQGVKEIWTTATWEEQWMYFEAQKGRHIQPKSTKMVRESYYKGSELSTDKVKKDTFFSIWSVLLIIQTRKSMKGLSHQLLQE